MQDAHIITDKTGFNRTLRVSLPLRANAGGSVVFLQRVQGLKDSKTYQGLNKKNAKKNFDLAAFVFVYATDRLCDYEWRSA